MRVLSQSCRVYIKIFRILESSFQILRLTLNRFNWNNVFFVLLMEEKMFRLPLALSEGLIEEGVNVTKQSRSFSSEVRSSVAVVLVEMAAADGQFDFGEARIIVRLLSRYFDLDQQEAFNLLSLANSRRHSGTSLDEAAQVLVRELNKRQRSDVFAMADRVMVHDRIIRSEERKLRDRLGKLLRLSDDEQLRTLSEARLAQEVGEVFHQISNSN